MVPYICKAWNLPENFNINLWCDAKVVLNWLCQYNVKETYIHNRVKQIRELCNTYKQNITLRYVPTDLNPADIITKVQKAKEFVINQMWWDGPKWLLKESDWPKADCKYELYPEENENKTAIFATAVIDVGRTSLLKFFDRANFSTGLRNTAYMMRAVRRFKKAEPPYDSKTISKGELDQAKIVAIKVMQSDMFSDQLAILQRGSKVNSGPYRKWGLYIDSDGVIRCDIHTNDHLLEPSARTNPILIHGKHPFVESYFRYKHKHSNCSSRQYTLHKVRKELHGPSLTVTVNKIVRECNACRILRAKPYAYPKMPPLPKERLAAERPFAVCGVDYSGPHHVKEGRSRKKIWIALFTCMVSRAVHLEVGPDISALTFLQALQSLAWKKGTPKLLMSDNATCFTGANRLLKEMSEERQVQVDLATKGIEWSFTPPRAPWFGAIYERLIGVMKKELVKLIGHSLLTYHELTTNLAQVEGIVNSRPLIQVGTEEVLTPMNILTGRDDNKDDILNVLDTK